VASLVAAVELVLLLAAAVLLLAKPLSRAMRHHATATALAPAAVKHTTAPAKPKRRHVAVPKAKLTPAKTGVLVLNGNGRQGAAAAAAARLHRLGYRVEATGNAKRQDFATTVVMYRSGYRGDASRLAHRLHVKVIGPLDGLPRSALHGGQLAIVLGAE
jgi:hypothetical protein